VKKIPKDEPDYGFVYALANHAMPHLFKIGFTAGSPSKRAIELSKGSGVPTVFEVVGFFETERPRHVESWIHEALDDYRFNANREFFKLHRAHLLAVMRLHAREYGVSAFVNKLVPETYDDLDESVDLMRDLDAWECGGGPSAPLAGCIDKFYVNANLPIIRDCTLLAGGRP
jgi:hypothetical protein